MAVVISNPGMTAPTEQERELVAEPEKLRKMSLAESHSGVPERQWGFAARLNPNVSLEEYEYYAQIERELEEIEHRQRSHVGIGKNMTNFVKGLLRQPVYEDDTPSSFALPGTKEHAGEKADALPNIDPIAPGGATSDSSQRVTDAEWRQAARALRTASWGGVFYLITTDILGWGQTPYVFANTGYGIGVGIFVLMGIAAAFSGYMIWKTFLALDSSRYPVLSFGDPFFRLLGPTARHVINVLQSLQMFLTVAVLQLGQTGILAQLAGDVDLCFVACGVIILVVGMASGYMRALKHLGWLCNLAVWLNVVSFIIICVAAAKYGPDVTPQVSLGILNKAWLTDPAPVTTFIGTPTVEFQPTDANLFAAKFNGINSMVYAYSGALLFVAFLAEMRHPMDFWKACWLAQLFIGVIYIFFGAFAYTYYGQYAYSVITQVVQPLSLQIVSNVLGLITGWLALFLYFNIGLKTVYLEVGQEVLGLPPITTRAGKLCWWGFGPLYWILVFVVAMSVPQFNAFTNFVGGLFSLNFTYSFSGVMFIALKIQQYAKLPGEGFDPATGVTTRLDSGVKRYMRGYMKGWKWTIPVTIYTGCGFAASGMGTWAAILALESAFGPGGSTLTSWTCYNPYYSGNQ